MASRCLSKVEVSTDIEAISTISIDRYRMTHSFCSLDMKFSDTTGEAYDKVFNHLDMLHAPLEGKLVKDRFNEELPKSDLEKCLFWPLKVMFEPVATDGLWQFEAPIKSWKLYKSCSVHCLTMEGMIIYMLDDVEYPLQKSTLQKMLDHKCEVSEFNENVIQMINLIRRQLKKE
ncbi:hypothetical protein Tco_0468803 [Tanacetum coccineum]